MKRTSTTGIALGVKPTTTPILSLNEFGARRAGVDLAEVRVLHHRRVKHPLLVFTADDLRRVATPSRPAV